MSRKINLSPFFGTHDLGMAFDLGVSDYIQRPPVGPGQNDPNDVVSPQVAADIAALPAMGTWSVENAVSYSAKLPQISNGVTLNDQVSAVRSFLSLYAVTQSSSWGLMTAHVVNGTVARDYLFGSGVQNSKQLISKVVIGGTGSQNPYPNMRKVLSALGVGLDPQASAHNSHFHIYLNPPEPKPVVPAKLQADSYAMVAEEGGASVAPIQEANIQGVLDYVETLTSKGDELMFVMDVPYSPSMDPAIVLAQAVAPNTGSASQADLVLTICNETQSTGNPKSALRAVDPAGMLVGYLSNRAGRPIDYATLAAITPVLLEDASHGRIVASKASDSGRKVFRYDPELNYVGSDRAVFSADYAGKRYRIVVNFVVSLAVGESPLLDGEEPVCPPPQLIKINGKPVSGSSAYQLKSYTITFGDLSGAVVGQTTGDEIALDLTSAGHGWYVDPTPLDNTDDYLPTSNPNVWQAKAGTDAAGKMDLLSVLLHEYGHALGLDHSSDSGDFMAATLKPGERRLPGTEELQLMSELVAQLKAGDGGEQAPTTPSPLVPSVPLGALLLGRLTLGRRSDTEDGADQGSQALFAAHPTLQGGGLQSLQDWATQGQVSVASGSAGNGAGGATLQETSSSQTRLNQVFMVGPNDRYLSFTLSNLALDDQAAGPDDAFEAALLNADTGANLMGGNGLTRSDALLNLQANGSEFAAQGVTHVTHADGSRSYVVDLAGMARNADGSVAVNLSFDLIGFGANGSHVTVSDVRLFGQPQTADDAASGAEDAVLTIPALANDQNANLPGLAPVVVAAPAHGTVVANADGTFSYTPAADYYGADSFTYQLSGSAGQSNLATVTLTIAPVNDAPVAADLAVSTAEDTPLAIQLVAADVDSAQTALQYSVRSAPRHGALALPGPTS